MTPLFPARLCVCFSALTEVDRRVVSTAMQEERLVDAFMMSHCQLTARRDM